MSLRDDRRPTDMAQVPQNVSEYLDGLPPDARPHVGRVLDAVGGALPAPEERTRYGMPAIMLEGRHPIHVAGWSRDVGVYPGSSLPEPLETAIAPYRAAKDALHFR